jgi:hypothetical protein
MKSYLLKTDARLHGAVKDVRKLSAGSGKLTLQEVFEVGMLLVLAERGKVDSFEAAEALGANQRSALVFRKILAGEKW